MQLTLEMILKAIELAGYQSGKDIILGLDVRARNFLKKRGYSLKVKRKYFLPKFVEYLARLTMIILLLVLRWYGRARLAWLVSFNKTIRKTNSISGDDVFVTIRNITKRHEQHVANAILINLIKLALYQKHWQRWRWRVKPITTQYSHRSGETER